LIHCRECLGLADLAPECAVEAPLTEEEEVIVRALIRHGRLYRLRPWFIMVPRGRVPPFDARYAISASRASR
jgi:hypothetical protein